MNFLEVLMLSREELMLMAAQFPLTGKVIRRSALLLALRRYLIVAAAQIKAERMAALGLTAENGRPAGAEKGRKSELDKAFNAASSHCMSSGEAALSHQLTEGHAFNHSSGALRQVRTSREDMFRTSREDMFGGSSSSPAQREAMGQLKAEVETVKDAVAEIKAMLAQALNARAGAGAPLPAIT